VSRPGRSTRRGGRSKRGPRLVRVSGVAHALARDERYRARPRARRDGALLRTCPARDERYCARAPRAGSDWTSPGRGSHGRLGSGRRSSCWSRAPATAATSRALEALCALRSLISTKGSSTRSRGCRLPMAALHGLLRQRPARSLPPRSPRPQARTHPPTTSPRYATSTDLTTETSRLGSCAWRLYGRRYAYIEDSMRSLREPSFTWALPGGVAHRIGAAGRRHSARPGLSV
jgi:hypothetical protein